MNERQRFEDLVEGFVAGTLQDAEVKEFLALLPGQGAVMESKIGAWLESRRFEYLGDEWRGDVIFDKVMGRASLRSGEGGREDAETERGAKDSSQGSELEVNHGDTGTQRGTEINTDAEIPSLAQEEEGHEDAKTRRGTKDTSLREDEEKEDTEVPSQAQEGERKVVRIWRWVAAAVVIGVMGLGVWWMMGRNNTVEKPGVAVVPKAQDVAPGRQGAILTLSDGKQIVLDSAGNGALALQGKTSIVKQGGELRYEKSGAVSSEEVVYNTMTTPKGRQYSLLLADGSKVWLNAASSIKFPTAFTGNTRVVEITGEAYFEVAHNAAKPFIVSVGDMQVEVLGTHFNINSYGDEGSMKTTLLEGKVRVTRNGSIAVLKPGQQAAAKGSGELEINNDVDVDKVMAWKDNRFYFQDDDVQMIMRQLERWYNIDVVYDNAIANQYTGIISRDVPISKVLQLFERTGDIKFSIEGRTVHVRATK